MAVATQAAGARPQVPLHEVLLHEVLPIEVPLAGGVTGVLVCRDAAASA